MRHIGDTITRLNRIGALGASAGTGATQFASLTGFGSNPGALAGFSHVPSGHAAMPLVVVLHGCTQTAAGYDRGSGWSSLADRFGFALLFPEQARANNSNGCFNWFVPEDTRRDDGEAASIRQMIAAMASRFPIDPSRIFVTGLSAGGAMTSVMLATYPEVFAGGAIIAGLPYGAAASMPQAFDRMRGHGYPSDEAGAAAIRAVSQHRGPWPSVSVWHGTADRTVDVVNADRIVGQWRSLQGLVEQPDTDALVDGQRHRAWRGSDGNVAVEDYRIASMGHGTPLSTTGETACGVPMPFMLDAGISSTWHIAKGWGLLGAETAMAESAPATAEVLRPAGASFAPPTPSGIQATIEAALRSAGLMR